MNRDNLSIPQELISKLRSEIKVVVLTGAGISAESGIPTFREAQTGLWSRYRPEELATPVAFQRNPRLVWDWYAWRRNLISQSSPNPGHMALVEMERHFSGFTLITQNVDGLHQRAGSGLLKPLIELHGNIQRTRCFDRGHVIEEWEQGDSLPACPICGSLLRPDVVWFGEAVPSQALHAAWDAASKCEIFFSIGTSAAVEPAASLPYAGKQAKALVVEINPQVTPLTQSADYAIHGLAGQILPSLVELCCTPQGKITS